jgi:hypothetical protein
MRSDLSRGVDRTAALTLIREARHTSAIRLEVRGLTTLFKSFEAI